jgi:hypothetical protein
LPERADNRGGSQLRRAAVASTVPAVPVLSRCEAPGCELLTIGQFCIRHDASSLSILARQRRWRWERTAPGPAAPGRAVEPEPLPARV